MRASVPEVLLAIGTLILSLGASSSPVAPVERCPYMALYPAFWWPSSAERNAEERDISERVLSHLAMNLVDDHGFYLVTDVEDAYWLLRAIARERATDRGMAYGFAEMEAFAKFESQPVRVTYDRPGETVRAGRLLEFPAAELESFLRLVADVFGADLLAHANHMCADWSSGLIEEEARLERIRQELVREMERVRARRAELNLRIEVEPQDRPQ